MSSKKSTRIKKVSSSEDGPSSKASNSSSSIISLVKLGGAVLAVFLAVSYYKRNQQSNVQDLTTADADALKDAFFGDLPYLFYCSKGGSESVPAPFEELNAAKSSSMGFAKVNCSQVLPSGKTVMQRFKIKKDVRPTVFATAPWMKPQQVSANHMKDATTLTKFIDNTMAPKPTQVFSDKDLRNFCDFGGKNVVKDKNSATDTCLVLLRGAKYNAKVHAELEKRLVQQYPKVRIAAVDAKKKRLSFEETGDYLPAEDFALKVHALRNRTHYLSMVNPVTWDYLDTFVSQTIGTPSYDFTGEVDTPVTLNKIKTAEEIEALKAKIAARVAARAARTAASAAEAANAASGAAGGAAAETDPAALEAERVRKERLRREQMERQAQEHVFDEAEDAESEETNGSDGEDEDAEGDHEGEDDEVVEL
eukprot:gene9616-11309_t